MRVTAGDGVDVAVHDLGGTGTPVLMSHATGFHGRCYVPMAAAMAAHHHAWALDYHGHGATPAAGGSRVDWADMGHEALAVARAIAPDGGLVGFGHSMGGAALLMAASRDPGLFSQLVLYEPIVLSPEARFGLDRGDNHMAIAARRRRATFDSFQHAIDHYGSKPPMMAFDPEALRCYVEFGFEPANGGVRLRCTPEQEARTFEGSTSVDTWALLPEIATPTVVAAGRLGDGPERLTPAVAERLPAGEFVQLEHLDHFGPMTHPGELAELVIRSTAGGQ